MHPVCSHDLPNQVVALQSLLQLFEWDEADQLSPQGREYFSRLQSIGRKMTGLVQYLKQLSRLNRVVPRPEQLSLAPLLRQLQSEARRAYPELYLTWQDDLQSTQAFADPRMLQQGILQLLRAAATNSCAKAMVVDTQAKVVDGHVECVLALRRTDGVAPSVDANGAPDHRLALALAQEYFAATDVVCQCVENNPPYVVAYTLVIPDRSRHG